MTRRLLALAALAALAAAGCSDQLGRRLPDCDPDEVTMEIVAQAQAVPTATVGACISELEPGWSYEHQVAESGKARFWLSSDRMGERFVAVTLQGSCDPGAAIRRPAPAPGVEAFLEGSPYIAPVAVTIVPTSERVVSYAASIGVDLAAERANGRPFQLYLGNHRDPSQAVAEALAGGRIVIVVDDTDAADGTLELQLADGDQQTGLSLLEAIEEIEEEVEDPSYDVTWYFVFSGGCITWRFDAEGEMVATIEQDMARAVGFYDLAELRRIGAEMGLYVGPPP